MLPPAVETHRVDDVNGLCSPLDGSSQSLARGARYQAVGTNHHERHVTRAISRAASTIRGSAPATGCAPAPTPQSARLMVPIGR